MKDVQRHVRDVLLGALLVALALGQAIPHLGGTTFQNDEYYHIDAARGYIESGEPVLWDFMHSTPQRDDAGKIIRYDRAWVYTWQVVQSVKIFGFTETAARAPSVIWFALWIALAFVLLRIWSKDILFAFLVTLVFVGFDHFVLHGRLLRMYSMFLFWSTLAMTLWYCTYRYLLREGVSWWKWALLGVVTLAVTAMAYLTHLVIVLAIPIFLVFLGMEYMWLRTKRTGIWFAAGILLAWIGLIITVLTSWRDRLDFFGLRHTPNFSYLRTPFEDLPLWWLGLVSLIIGGVLLLRERDSSCRYVAVMSLGVLLLFVFGVKRYHAIRYILFMVPWFITVGAFLLYRMLQIATQRTSKAWLRTSLIAAVFIVLFVPLSWPGVEPMGLIRQARADRIHENGYGHNFRYAYDFIKARYQPDDVLLSVVFRTYYWGEDEAQVIGMGSEQSMTLKDLKALMETHKRGWIFWSNGKSHHLSKQVKTFIQKNTRNVTLEDSELEKANMSVYYFRWSDIPEVERIK